VSYPPRHPPPSLDYAREGMEQISLKWPAFPRAGSRPSGEKDTIINADNTEKHVALLEEGVLENTISTADVQRDCQEVSTEENSRRLSPVLGAFCEYRAEKERFSPRL